jgi:hypothetical protein
MEESKKSDSGSESDNILPKKYKSERVAVEYRVSSKSSENLGSDGKDDDMILDGNSLKLQNDQEIEKSSSSSDDKNDSKDDYPESNPGL